MSARKNLTIEIDAAVLAELEYIVYLHRQHGAPNPAQSLDELVRYVLSSVADGSRRPGSWERGLLDSMGLVAECAEHQQYRAHYGSRPDQDDDDAAPR